MPDGAMITLPVLPLRDIVVFPHMIVPLFVGREKSIRALEAVMAEDKQIILVTQKEADTEDPDADGLYTIGTVGSILQLLKLPDGAVKVLVEGGERVVIDPQSLNSNDGFLAVDAEILEQENHVVVARLDLSKAGVKQSFVTRNSNQPHTAIRLALEDGPFEALSGEWRFDALSGEACRVSLDLTFQLRSGLLKMAASRLFETVANDMVDAMVKRANQLAREKV